MTPRLSLGTPPHAAISTALPLLAGGPRRLAHGVFGTLSRQGAALPDTPVLPESVAKRWSKNWGEPVVSAAAAAIAVPPPLDLTLKEPAETAAWAEKLGGKSLLPGHVRCDRASVADLPGFSDGAWWVQDIAASIPARLMGSGEGRRALDLCAAPGGKTLQLAARGWQVTAVDRAGSRLARLSDNLARTGLSAEVVAEDALDWAPGTPFDAILLDAPCSATGIFRRHPDVLYRAHPHIVAECAEIQAAMLKRAAGWLKPGGVLVYAVCSLEPEEGERVAAAFLGIRPDFAAEPPKSAELPEGIAPDAAGFVRVLPGAIADQGGADGFFIAQFRHS
jgi:16S rRNA (cytosine967-C5)-methyltransferase